MGVNGDNAGSPWLACSLHSHSTTSNSNSYLSSFRGAHGSPQLSNGKNNSKPRTSRGIVHALTESGTARFIFDEDFSHFRGLLLNNQDESISLTGTANCREELVNGSAKKLEPSLIMPTTSRAYQIIVIDGETGDKFCLENVKVMKVPKLNPITNHLNHWVEINHSAIKFKTKEILIGNRADVEMQQYLGGAVHIESSSGTLSRSNSKGLEHKAHTQVHIGQMSLNVVASEKTQPSARRVSVCDGCATNIIEQSDDFLV